MWNVENIEDNFSPVSFLEDLAKLLASKTGKNEEEVLTSNQFHFRLIWKLETEGRQTKRTNQIRQFLRLRESLGLELPAETAEELRNIFLAQFRTLWKPAKAGTSQREIRFSRYDASLGRSPFRKRSRWRSIKMKPQVLQEKT